MNQIKKTGFEWCFEQNIRVKNLNDWMFNKKYSYSVNSYFTEKIDFETFTERINNCHVIENSMPRKTEMFLEYRMYGLVPYNMSPIQQGIQFGHAVVDYGQTVREMPNFHSIYDKWAKTDKTFIILNGGTTNTNPERLGTLNKHMNTLIEAGVMLQPFYEPDMGDQLTAFVFLVDERVYNRTLYPDFNPETLPWSRNKPSEKQLADLEARNKKNYDGWLEKIGGAKNAFMRDYLKTLKLA